MCNFVCGTTCKGAVALVSHTLSIEFLVTFWAWFGNVYQTGVIGFLFKVNNSLSC